MRKMYYVASPNAFRKDFNGNVTWAKKTLSEAINHAEELLEKKAELLAPHQEPEPMVIVMTVALVKRKPRKPVKSDYIVETIR